MFMDDVQEDIVESWQVLRLDQLTSLVAGLAGRDDIRLQFGKRWAWLYQAQDGVATQARFGGSQSVQSHRFS